MEQQITDIEATTDGSFLQKVQEATDQQKQEAIEAIAVVHNQEREEAPDQFANLFTGNDEFKHRLEDELKRLSTEAQAVREKLDASKTDTAKKYHKKKLTKITSQIVKGLTMYHGLGYHSHEHHDH